LRFYHPPPAVTEKVYLDLHKSFVKEDIPYIDKQSGEERTFNSVALPADTIINGKNVGDYDDVS
jgi:hypothetical protein